MTFPCKECLVLSCCSELCDRVHLRKKLGTQQLLYNDICPDCGHKNDFNIKNVEIQSLYILKCKNCNHDFKMSKRVFMGRGIMTWGQ